MPNGGTDCCGTCRFNRANAGRREYIRLPDENIADYCEIRGLDIEVPFWTYCANHTDYSKRKYTEPLGPVYMHESVLDVVKPKLGKREPLADRHPWVDAPDTEEVRAQLLCFLKDSALRSDGYPWHRTSLLYEVVNELERLREPRAIPILEQIAKDLCEKGEEPDGIRNVIERIQSAVEADRGGHSKTPDAT